MNNKQKNNELNKEKNDKKTINKNAENENENKQNNDIKVEKQNENKQENNNVQIKNEHKSKTEKTVKSNDRKKKGSKNIVITIITIIVVIIVIDIVLAVKTISNNENKTQEDSVNEEQNIIENVTENKIDHIEEISYTDFSMNNYNFRINSKYKIDIQNDILTIQNNEEKSIVTINAGTMEQIQNNLHLLTVPIENQGATIIKAPELQNINGKDVYVLEYSIDQKNYIVVYTKLDEENIIDMIAESISSIDILIELSNNYTKI